MAVTLQLSIGLFAILFLSCQINAVSLVDNRPLIPKNPFFTDGSFGKFLVINQGKEIYLPNQKSSKGLSLLKLSINGATVDKIEPQGVNEWTWKLSDGNVVNFSMNDNDAKVTKHTIRLPGTLKNGREVCFHYGDNDVSWYAGYHSSTPQWPLNTSRVLPQEDFANVRNFTYNAAKEDFLSIMEQLFVSSNGFAIALDPLQPLFMRRDPNHEDPILCFSANNSQPYNSRLTDAKYKDLTIYVFAGENARVVTDHVIHRSGLIGKPSDIPDESKFTYPSWSNDGPNTRGLFANSLTTLDLAEQIVKNGFPAKGEIMIDGYMQREYGDVDLDTKNYPDAKKMITELHAKGFKVGMAVNGRIQKYRKNLQHSDNATREFFINDYRDIMATVLVDFSYAEARTWYEYLMRHMKYEFGIDSFQLNSVGINWLLQFHDPQVQNHPGLISKLYVETGAKLGKQVVSNVGYKTQHLPNFVRLPNIAHQYRTNYEDIFAALIPNALAVSIAGYSFFIPYQVGGFSRDVKPIEEMYIRWVQATAFMPSMSFLHYPWNYPNQLPVLNLTQKFVNLHIEHAPTLIALAKKRVAEGSPIIRPLWYVAPDEPATYRINDQFMVGDDILVAPVLKMGQIERSVYLPAGVWIDQHGAQFNGKSTIKVKAPIEELPYFKRLVK